MDQFRVRLNCIDSYQAAPTRYDPLLRNDVRRDQFSKQPRVPIVRVFGSTDTGQKVCAHIHGAFPYLYVEYEGSLARRDVGVYISSMHQSIDRALAISFRQDAANDNPRFVARITIVKGIPFYGFHIGYRYYLKIYMLNPAVMNRLTDMLHQGLIMNRKFQPYEAHIQYLLQFMTDYNLYGCDDIRVSKIRFRAPVPDHEDLEDSIGGVPSRSVWHTGSIDPRLITSDISLQRMSHCAIEVDICVWDISNRRDVKERRLHHDFIERTNPLPADLKLVHSMAGLWADETKRRKRRLGNKAPGSSPFPAEVLVPMSAGNRVSQLSGWIHEDEFRQEIQQLIDRERAEVNGVSVTYESFVREDPLGEGIKTALESVEDLYPANLARSLGVAVPEQEEERPPPSSIEVDEQGIIVFTQREESVPDDVAMEILREAKEETVDESLLARQDRHPEIAGGVTQVAYKFIPDSNCAVTAPQPPSEPRDATSMKDVGKTVLGTSHDPDLPASQGLLDFLEQGDWLSDHDDEKPPEMAGREKRKESPVVDTMDPKRLKMGYGRVPMPERKTLGLVRVTPNKKAKTTQHQSLSQRKTSSQKPSSQKKPSSQGNQALNFPVVKDTQEHTMRLRLSQKTSSQQSEDVMTERTHPGDSLATIESFVEDSQLTTNTTQRKKISFGGNVALDKMADVTPMKTPATFPSLDSSPMPYAIETRTLRAATKAIKRSIPGANVFMAGTLPPTSEEVTSTMQAHGLPDVIYREAYYSNEKDVPAKPREYAGREFKLESRTLPYLPAFDPDGQSPAIFGEKDNSAVEPAVYAEQLKQEAKKCTIRSWEIALPPPTYAEVETWWTEKTQQQNSMAKTGASSQAQNCLSQIEGATQKNKYSFKYSQGQKKGTSVRHEAQYMSTMSVEIHVSTRGKLIPDPEHDEIQCIFWALSSDSIITATPSTSSANSGCGTSEPIQQGIILLSEPPYLYHKLRKQTSSHILIDHERSELDLFSQLVTLIRTYDPDIITGYEVHTSSWGYIISRATIKYDYNLCADLSRTKSQSFGRMATRSDDAWSFKKTSSVKVTGRHVINVWRAMRGELNLPAYTLENVAWHLLHRRFPRYAWETLTHWYINGRPADLAKVVKYHLARSAINLEILTTNELIPRTLEQARLLGVDFFSVFGRGSQFKVESIMSRICKPENFMLASPSRKQVGGQNALECLPLVMEPQSGFYTSPLVVLDFQSLYPSVMIAHNYCYSTFAGRLPREGGMGDTKMGFSTYTRPARLLELLGQENLSISPNGLVFLRPEVRKSLLAKMLTEILETRVMVKSGMKEDKDDKALQQLLNNRQLALKLLANVTYGYTSASFSGRMPCAEIADAIVQTGRETLEKAIAMIHAREEWGAEVVYGDTDSLFIYLPGRTREQAFKLGRHMAEAVTASNPRPVKLKFEKVYHPCVLLAKKRYVGYKYEYPEQQKPEFDAKGIETVRRDGTPAEQKIEEKCLRLLFETQDLTKVKAYFQSQCRKIATGDVGVQDFTFAKEVKLGTYSDKGLPPPGALVATRKMMRDKGAEPQYGERVPYVVIAGPPGARLADRCVDPEEVVKDGAGGKVLDVEYYVGKNIVPPLERIFNLVGVSVRGWWEEMPKVQRVRRIDPGAVGRGGRLTIEAFLRSANCVVCGVKIKMAPRSGGRRGDGRGGLGGGGDSTEPVCRRCARDVAGSVARLETRVSTEQKRMLDVVGICQTCTGDAPLEEIRCESRDCPVYYTRMKQAAKLRVEEAIVRPVVDSLARSLDW